jgi:RimJ/RimL family protein N-acetyltransferase
MTAPMDHAGGGIRGRRVFLRPLERADLPLVLHWNADAATRRLVGDLPRSLASAEQRYDEGVAEQGVTFFSFAICRVEDGRMVGRIDLFDIDRINGSAALGIVIGDPADRGQGYGGDAVDALVDFAFGELRLERVWLATDAENVRAQATYRRSGFVEEARHRHAFTDRGRFIDEVQMSILREEWLALDRPRSWDLAGDPLPGSAADDAP